jgi:hypothetical protein
MSQTPFQSTLANASFKGFPFNTQEVELKGGLRSEGSAKSRKSREAMVCG